MDMETITFEMILNTVRTRSVEDRLQLIQDILLSVRSELALESARNVAILDALGHFFQELERQIIDHQLAAMADDPAYQAMSVAISEAWAASDWEALSIDL